MTSRGGQGLAVRLDKWLQVARAFKTRSQATKACVLGRVLVNGLPAKPHRQVAIDDRVEFEKGRAQKIWIVRELRDKPLPKAEAARIFEDLSPPPPEPDPMERLMRRRPVEREKGAGRPTKQERRRMERWRRRGG